MFISLNMHSLKDNSHEVDKIFSEGNLVIRHAMIENWQDWHTIHLAVKQTIMRSYKSNGVQKRGKDFKETHGIVWLLFLPNSSTFNFKMQELTNVNSAKSEWCKNFTRFIIDIRKVLNYFTTKDNSVLGSIATKVIGNKLRKIMTGKDILNVARRLKLYQQEHQLNLAVKVKLLLFLTYCFKG